LKNSSENVNSKFWGAQTISQGAFIISFFTVCSGVLGLLRDRILSSHFLVSKIGATYQSLDVYYAAFYLPDTIYYLVFSGALAAALIPIFTTHLSRKEEKEAFYLINCFLNLALLVIFLACIAIFLFAPYLIKIITPGFSLEKQKLTVSLIRLMLLSPIFFSISYTSGAVLNSFKHFTLVSLAPCFYNLAIIIMTLLFYRQWGIYAPAIGVVLGAFSHMLLLSFGAYRLGFRWKPIFNPRYPGVKKIIRLMLPRTAALGIERINRFVYILIASTLATGSLSIINLAENLQIFPVSFLSIPLATAIFPFLAESASLKNYQQFNRHLAAGIRFILYLMIPLSAAIFLLRVQIVRLVLGAGHFGWTDTKLTGAALGIFALSLAAQGLAPLLARSFYALHDTASPFKFASITILVNAFLAYLFTHSGPVGIVAQFLKAKNGFDSRIIGLPLAFSLTSFLYVFLLYFKLKKQIRFFDAKFHPTLGKILLSTVACSIGIQLTKHYLGLFLDLNKAVNVLIQFSFPLLVGVAIYLSLTYLWKMEEAHKLFRQIKRKKLV